MSQIDLDGKRDNLPNLKPPTHTPSANPLGPTLTLQPMSNRASAVRAGGDVGPRPSSAPAAATTTTTATREQSDSDFDLESDIVDDIASQRVSLAATTYSATTNTLTTTTTNTTTSASSDDDSLFGFSAAVSTVSAASASVSLQRPSKSLLASGSDFIHSRLGITPKKMARMFPEIAREDESVVLVYNCALEKDILWQGKLYCTTNYFCFLSVVFGKTERLIIRLRDVISIEKKMTAGVFPNAIKITLLDGKYTFASFLKRDSSYADISAHWKAARGNPKVILGSAGSKHKRRSEGRLMNGPNPDLTHASSSDDNGEGGAFHLQNLKGALVKSMGALNDGSSGENGPISATGNFINDVESFPRFIYL
ncbi:UNVERIFIED_CONTAM: hypothetical protein HDU68_005351 [Siphonaria sp. JEL0065]|nr:hypothetical protein HDU68_005351 [Siphonaria sp. JEL0065]